MNTKLLNALPLLFGAVILLVIAGVVFFVVRSSNALPDGPVEIVWDKAACAACGMHVGEPGFAAQYTTKDGKTYAFDDPGCLFLFAEQQRPDLHAVWFHHHRESRWLSQERVAFARVEVTPMGFGIAAVDPGAAELLDYPTAKALCLTRNPAKEDS